MRESPGMTDPVARVYDQEGGFLGTLKWVGVFLGGALLALLLLSWLGPVGQ
ncbi:MAG TPA: hypothetical protein VFX59_03145 [Polyangiales bacterium]|nr:hypothetical protein [Polyangiales bacterium]